MKKTALLIATLTAMSVAAQNQPGQSQSQNQSKQSSSQSSQSQPGQSGQSQQSKSQSSQGASAQRQSGSQQGQMQSAQFIDFKVVDKQDKQLGTVEALWDDQSGQPAFVAVKRQGEQELLVIPAQKVEVNRSQQTIRVPYEQQALQSAPKFNNEQEMDRQAQMKIVAFYRQHGYQEQPQQRQQQQSGAQSSKQQDQATVTLKEEQLKVGTRQVDAGGILLKKVVRTDKVNRPVELQREEIVIERVEGTGRPVKGEIGTFEEGQIYIPLRREEAVVEKETRVKEVVNVGKRTETERENVSGQVREEELQIIKERGTDLQFEGQRPGSEQQRQQQERQRQQQQRQQQERP